jgi:CBS domain-containing protein
MTVGKVCTRSVVTAPPEETVQSVAQRMAQDDVGTLIVIEAHTPVGIITDRDLVLRVMAKELRPQETPVSAAMTRDPVCITEHTALEEAIALMRGYHVRRLVVVNEHKEFVGILSLDDLLLKLSEEQRAIAGLTRAARSRRE